MLSSDPHAWLREYYAKLSANPTYRMFAPSHQFAQLVEAVAVEHPSQAEKMKQWSVGAQVAAIGHLASMVEQRASMTSVDLWSVSKGERTLRCAAFYLPIGIHLRLLEDEDFRRTQLVRDAPTAHELAGNWLTALQGSGWALRREAP